MNKQLYFDHAATTPLCLEAAKKSEEYSLQCFANPSSSHSLGREAARAINEARKFFAGNFGVEPEQVIFTGSGTESDNLAIYGVHAAKLAQKLKSGVAQSLEFACSSVEHPAVKKTIRSLEDFGTTSVQIPVNAQAQIEIESLKDFISEKTNFLSVMRVNNIVGSVFPVEELAREAKRINPKLVFHSDCVQAFGKISIPRSPSSVDLVSISSHKVEGPKGVGALIVLNRNLLDTTQLRPLIFGGGQENGFRSGTQSAALISGFHAAAQKTLFHLDEHSSKVSFLRENFKNTLKKDDFLSESLRWNSPENAVPNITNLSAPRIPSSALLKLLEKKGIIASAGSACSSTSTVADPVLTSMGLLPEHAKSSFRISFSNQHSVQDVQSLTLALKEALSELRDIFSVRTKALQ
jgi:cysteine desulfurase